MRKRLISVILILTMVVSLLGVSAISAGATDNIATVRVGGKNYTFNVGDYFQYNIAFTYSGNKLATGQVELPVNFAGLNSYSEQELQTYLSKIAPTTGSSSVIVRSDGKSTIGVKGYVMNFVNPNGYSFSTSKVVLSLLFSVEKTGSYELAAKVNQVDDINAATVVNKDSQVTDNRFSYTESVSNVELDTPNVKVNTDAGGVKISWDPVPRASLYRVYYKGSNGWTRLTDTTNTSFLDTDVISGKTYTYTVRCLSADGSKFVSSYDKNGKSATYYTAPRPKLSCAEDGVSIKWDAVTGAAKYRLYYRSNNNWYKLIDTTSTSYVDKDVESGSRYTYTIRCMDSSGKLISWFYDNCSITFLSAPTFKVSNVANGVQISWSAVNGAANYRVFYYGSNGWKKLTDTANTSVIDTDVSSNHTYTYTVRCINADGTAYTSDYRAGKKVKYFEAPKLTLSNAEDGVKIKWNAVSGVSKYRIYYKGSNGWTKMVDTASTSYIDKDVNSGSNYTYTIRCMDASGNLISWYYSDGFKIKYIQAPKFTVSNAANGVQVSWPAVKGAEKYRVFYYGSNGWTRLLDTTETSIIDTDVRSSQTYIYTVRCIKADGSAYTSDYRAGKKVKYFEAPRLTLSNASSGVSIKWNAVSGASKYRIYLKGANGWSKLTDTSSTSYVHTGVTNGTKYTYTIRCMDASGNLISWYYTDGFSITYQ